MLALVQLYYTACSDDVKRARPATAAVTKTTRTRRDVSEWTVSDVRHWLQNNNLTHLLNRFIITSLVSASDHYSSVLSWCACGGLA